MNPHNKPLRPISPLNRDSEVRPIVDRMLPVVNHLSFVHPDLLRKIRVAIEEARREVEGALTNDNGQALLFDWEAGEELEIPERYANEVIRIAQAELTGRGFRLEKNHDSIKIVAGEDDGDNPYRGDRY